MSLDKSAKGRSEDDMGDLSGPVLGADLLDLGGDDADFSSRPATEEHRPSAIQLLQPDLLVGRLLGGDLTRDPFAPMEPAADIILCEQDLGNVRRMTFGSLNALKLNEAEKAQASETLRRFIDFILGERARLRIVDLQNNIESHYQQATDLLVRSGLAPSEISPSLDEVRRVLQNPSFFRKLCAARFQKPTLLLRPELPFDRFLSGLERCKAESRQAPEGIFVTPEFKRRMQTIDRRIASRQGDTLVWQMVVAEGFRIAPKDDFEEPKEGDSFRGHLYKRMERVFKMLRRQGQVLGLIDAKTYAMTQMHWMLYEGLSMDYDGVRTILGDGQAFGPRVHPPAHLMAAGVGKPPGAKKPQLGFGMVSADFSKRANYDRFRTLAVASSAEDRKASR